MSLKLYYHPLSTFSRRVLIAFAEKQIPHELAVRHGSTPSSRAAVFVAEIPMAVYRP
jgi:glutathione S-transferase